MAKSKLTKKQQAAAAAKKPWNAGVPNSLRHLSAKVQERYLRQRGLLKPPAAKRAAAKPKRKGTKTGTGRVPKAPVYDYAAGMANEILYSMASEAAMNP